MDRIPPRVRPYLVFASAWAVPGLGHLVQKKYLRAAVFFAGCVILLVMGLALQGQLGVLYDRQPATILKFLGSLGTGIFLAIAKAAGLGAGSPAAATFDIGTAYAVAAGLMNFLAAFHAFETAKGVRHV
jgi:hypothetical protein